MNSQINIRLPDTLLEAAREYATSHGFGTVQEFIRETVREKLFPDESLTKRERALVKGILEESFKHQSFRSEEELFEMMAQKSS